MIFNGRTTELIQISFYEFCSDNQKLIDYLIKHRDEIVDISVPYKELIRDLFNANTLLALSGDW